MTHIYETISGELEKLQVSFSRKLEKVGYPLAYFHR